MLDYIESGRSEGATVLTGGKEWPESNGGFWVEPTILTEAKPHMKVVKEEVRVGSLHLCPSETKP